MIQVTGLYSKNPGVVWENPILYIEFHGLPMGLLLVDVLVKNGEGATIGAFPFQVQKENLTFDPQISDPYNSLVNALQEKIAASLQLSNPYNATFQVL